MRSVGTGVVTLALVVGVSGLGLWMTLDVGPAEPSGVEWEAVSARIGSELLPGDVIRVAPFWLRDSAAPLERLVEGQGGVLDSSVPPDPMVEARHRRLWRVTALGRELNGGPGGATRELDETLPGGIRLERWTLPPSPIEVDLLAALGEARVERWGMAGGKRRRCVWRRDRFDCHGRSWEQVRVGVYEVAGSPRRCMVLHPYPDGGHVSVTWANVTLGAGLLVRSGFTLEAARNEKGSDGLLRVLIDGREVARRIEPQNGWTWTPTWVATADRRGALARVTLEMSADREAYRDLCVDAYVLSRALE